MLSWLLIFTFPLSLTKRREDIASVNAQKHSETLSCAMHSALKLMRENFIEQIARTLLQNKKLLVFYLLNMCKNVSSASF